MTSLENKVLQAASGEKRLDPDQQRRYLGTFQERVILALTLSDAQSSQIRQIFPELLGQIVSSYQNVKVKLSSDLSQSAQMEYLKACQQLKVAATIVSESIASSSYGLVIHSDQAIQGKTFDLDHFLSKLSQPPVRQEKKSFWSKLLGH